MKILLWLLLFPTTLLSQKGKVLFLEEKVLNDSLKKQLFQLSIYNDTGGPICLKVSTSFLGHILSRDTVEIAGICSDSVCTYNLRVLKSDSGFSANDLPGYPLILFPKSSFTVTISAVCKRTSKKSKLVFAYLYQQDINYPELLGKFNNHQLWDQEPSMKYRFGEITW